MRSDCVTQSVLSPIDRSSQVRNRNPQQAAKEWAPVSTSIDIEGVDLSFLSPQGQS